MRRRSRASAYVRPVAFALASALLLSSCAGPLAQHTQSRAAGASTTVTVKRGTIVATIAGSGSVAAKTQLDQSFQTNGKVTAVLVQEGDTVKAGQVLAKLDERDLQLAVGEAQAALNSAKAKFEQAKQGNATEEEKAAAQAQVDNAQAQLEKARTGNNTPADVKNAAASVRQAQANLQKTISGNNTAADVANAQASLRSAQASLQKTLQGSTTPADIASAEASVRSAEAQLRKAKTGNATPEDIANAEAKVRSAEAALQKAQQGPAPDKVSAAQAAVEKAQQSYDKTAAADAAGKATAEQNVSQAGDAVRLAQQAYQKAYWDNQQAQAGRDPATGKSFKSENQDEDVGKRKYQQALDEAALQLKQAESKLEQAKVSLNEAKQQEVTDLQTAQTQLNDAKVQLQEVLKGPKPEDIAPAQATLDQARNDLQKLQKGGTPADVAIAQASLDQARANLAKLKQGPTKAEVAIAQAQVDQARANLAKAQQGGTKAEISASQASVDQARANLEKAKQGGTPADVEAAQAQLEQQQANLEKLSAPATQTDLDIQAAAVQQSEQSVKRAQLNLEAATLKAPFDGIVTQVNVVPGSVATSSMAAVQLVDRSTLRVDLKLSENDAARAQLGQVVTLTIDSLSGWRATGKVSYIAPAATTTNDVVTYGVRVSFPGNDPRVKVGMTANINITTATKENVLLVPSSALLPKGTGRVVQVPSADGKSTREFDVQIGLSDGTNTEIVSGLKEGDKIVALPAATTGGTGPRIGP